MIFRKVRKNLKAISPIISVLLMIAIAVVASLVVYAWVMGYMSFQTAKTGQSIVIQSMANSTVGGTPSRLVVYVQNVGSTPVNVDANSLYVNGVQYATNVTAVTSILPQTTMTIGTTYSLTTVGTTSTTVDVKVTTEGGTYSEVTQSFP